MRICYAGYRNPHFVALTEYIERSLNSLGHEVSFFDYRHWFIPGRVRSVMPSLQEWDVQRINRKLIERVKRHSSQVLLVSGGFTILPETVDEIRRMKVTTVNWIADYPQLFEDYCRVGPHYDFMFFSGSDGLEEYRNRGFENGSWLPFACDPEFHAPVILTGAERKRFGNEICFVGSHYPAREQTLESIADFDVGIWGPGWNKISASSPLKKKVRGESVSADQWVKIFSASKISLNMISHPQDGKGRFRRPDAFRMANTKVFEILGCGVLQLTDARSDVTTLFEDGRHLAVYEDHDDLRRQLSRYLADESMREKIAHQGREEVLGHHTYRLRLQKLLSMITPALIHT